MLKKLSVKNNKWVLFIIAGAILIPLILFATASVYNPGNTRIEVTPSPVEEVPSPTEQEGSNYELELQVETPTTIPDSNVELELMSTVNQQEEGCFDCISSTIVEMRSGDQVEVWDYSCGGFSGECNYQFTNFGYVVEAIELREESMLVEVYPEESNE